jgi:hypothetical protein
MSAQIEVDRSLTPWENYNKVTINGSATVMFPRKFTVPEITGSLTGGGWVDIIMGSRVYCYQRKSGTKDFEYSYLKLENAPTGCDTNSDKDLVTVVTDPLINAEVTMLQIIPREPKLAGIKPIISFTLLKQE